jgi:TolB-like protein/DNA-binding winged helix-turn-helix (wHTH) protein/tetratricopeptide (TPR) repeat protein
VKAIPTKLSYEFGEFRLDTEKHRLLRDGEIVALTPKAVEALTVLIQRRGKLVERDELMNSVWGDTTVEPGNLDVTISRLRKALAENENGRKFIETVPRLGYKFVADVREAIEEVPAIIVEKQTSGRIIIDETISLGRKTVPGANVPSLSSGKRAKTIPIVAGTVVIATVALLAYLQPWKSNPPTASAAGINSIAVLPLKNLTGDLENDYLSDGLTDGLISSLSRIEGLKVISRGSVFGLKGKEIEPRDVGRRLGVTTIVEGGVVRNNDTARVSVRLVNTEDGRVLWAGEGTEHSFTNIFAIQDELARDIVRAIRPKIGGDEARLITRSYPKNPEAYQLYMKGRYFWNRRSSANLEKAINYFERALKLDPAYALAYSGLADCYALLTYFSPDHPFAETFPKAKALAEKALEIDGALVEPHATMGFVLHSYFWDWARAETEYKRALELNPNYATAHHWYAWYLILLGRRDESVQEMKRALELDPTSTEIHADLAGVLVEADRLDEAMKYAQAGLEMDSNFADTVLALGHIHRQKGELEQSIKEFEKARKLSQGRSDVLGFLGNAYALAGKRREALNMITELKSKPVKDVSPYQLAKVYVGLGEKEKALTALEEAYRERSGWVIALRAEPVFSPLDNEPRFQRLLRSLGLTL